MTNKNNNFAISGLVIGALAGGAPGAIIGSIVGSLFDNLNCPICGNLMKFIQGVWKCEKCGYVKTN